MNDIEYKIGQQLKKVFDGRIVTIIGFKNFGEYAILDGDFEPNHIVECKKIKSYYSVI